MSKARAYCACSRCGWGLFGHFYSHLSFLFSFSLFLETARYRLKYCLKRPLNTNNQPTYSSFSLELKQKAMIMRSGEAEQLKQCFIAESFINLQLRCTLYCTNTYCVFCIGNCLNTEYRSWNISSYIKFIL